MTTLEKWNVIAKRQKRKREREALVKPKAPVRHKPPDAVSEARKNGYFLTSEVAEKYKRAVAGIQHAILRGDLPFLQVKRFKMIKPADYEKYMEVKHMEKVERAKKVAIGLRKHK